LRLPFVRNGSTSGDGSPLNQHGVYLIMEGCDGAGQSKELIPDTALVKSHGCLILRFDPGTVRGTGTLTTCAVVIVNFDCGWRLGRFHPFIGHKGL